MIEGKAKSFEVTAEATDKYNDWLRKRLSTSVWTDCVSYYRTGGGDSKVIATFPGPVVLFWWFCRQSPWDKFHGIGSDRWEREKMMKKWRQLSVVFGIVVALASLMKKP